MFKTHWNAPLLAFTPAKIKTFVCVLKGFASFVCWIQNSAQNLQQNKTVFFLTTETNQLWRVRSLKCTLSTLHCDFFFKGLASVSPLSEPLRLCAYQRVTHFSPPPYSNLSNIPQCLGPVTITRESTAAFASLSLKALREKKNRSRTENCDQHHHLVAVSSIALKRYRRTVLIVTSPSTWVQEYSFRIVAFVECASCVCYELSLCDYFHWV